MPTAIEPAPVHRAPARTPLRAKVSAISIVLASMATLAIVFAMVHSADEEPAHMQSLPAQPSTQSRSVAAPAEPPAAAPQPKPLVLAMDDHGFVDSTSRCDPRQRAVAIARTAHAAMVVCRQPDGTYEYTGTRLHDGAFVRLDDVRVMPTGFEARNGGTTYRLSATELVVLAGEDLLSRDAIVQYRAG